ncbi:hypothetical protein FNU76_01155 [Chitinimonas arctica]|uniref:Type III secretion chaperone SycN n=1 Tax=Chitinimonas arctica TaxID=2594795 RepID=A0A516SAJ1_9NEIS|nr:hypothetical protein [Chitinimonas arctica]QDQ25068.1 hypothetical protein FNU76_01155 [Chitinimonas arctica]
MDLQIERQLERFFVLMGFPNVRIETKMEFWLPPFRLFVEVRNRRISLSVAISVSPVGSMAQLRQALMLCIPERTMGVPMRAFLISNWLVLSCHLPEGMDESRWLRLYRIQCKLLQNVVSES